MKRVFRYFVAGMLEWQVRRLQNKSNYKIIAVVGSIGKTSTKLAIGRALSKIAKTRYEDGNYNDRVTIPLVVFGHKNPSNVLNVAAWLKILISNEKQIREEFPYEYIVLELGTDGPGQIKEFSYLNVDLAVVTAITPEHMENFVDLDAVAKEELGVKEFSKNLLININLCDRKYLSMLDVSCRSYGTYETADIQIISKHVFELHVAKQLVYSRKETPLKPKQFSIAALLGVLEFIGCDSQKIVTPLLDAEANAQTAGRLQMLPGMKDSVIIDDTYNASPEAVLLAIEVLKSKPAPQKIAILGSMNELGKTSKSSHRQVGDSCSPQDIDLLVTIGTEANTYLAPAAKRRGCNVEMFNNPYEAGMFVAEHVKDKALILAKGSQNGVFAEEALKPLLKNEHDQKKLVRQSQQWLSKKRSQFEKL